LFARPGWRLSHAPRLVPPVADWSLYFAMPPHSHVGDLRIETVNWSLRQPRHLPYLLNRGLLLCCANLPETGPCIHFCTSARSFALLGFLRIASRRRLAFRYTYATGINRYRIHVQGLSPHSSRPCGRTPITFSRREPARLSFNVGRHRYGMRPGSRRSHPKISALQRSEVSGASVFVSLGRAHLLLDPLDVARSRASSQDLSGRIPQAHRPAVE